MAHSCTALPLLAAGRSKVEQEATHSRRFNWHNLMFKILLLLLLSATAQAKTVILLPQWHLSPNTKTLDIEKSKDLVQYKNQTAIYLVLDEWIKNGKVDLLLAEGCTGSIDQNFSEVFNGWDYKRLKVQSKSKNYQDIMTLIPLKLEAKYADKLDTFCADDLALIKKHQLIFSDLRALVGIYSRLKEHKNSPGKFSTYVKLLEESEKIKIKKPIEYSRNKIKSLIRAEKEMISKRNEAFLIKIETSKKQTIALIIGARHIPDLEKKLKKKAIKTKKIPLIKETLPKEDFYSKLKKSLDL